MRNTFWPVLLEFVVGEFWIPDDIGITDQEIITRTCFKYLLLRWQPGGLFKPDVNFGNLFSGFIRFRRQFQLQHRPRIYLLFVNQSYQISLLQIGAGSSESEKQKFIHQRAMLPKIVIFYLFYLRIVEGKFIS